MLLAIICSRLTSCNLLRSRFCDVITDPRARVGLLIVGWVEALTVAGRICCSLVWLLVLWRHLLEVHAIGRSTIGIFCTQHQLVECVNIDWWGTVHVADLTLPEEIKRRLVELDSCVLLWRLGREDQLPSILRVGIHSRWALTTLALVLHLASHHLVLLLLLSIRLLTGREVRREQRGEVPSTARSSTHLCFLVGASHSVNVLDQIVDFLLGKRWRPGQAVLSLAGDRATHLGILLAHIALLFLAVATLPLILSRRIAGPRVYLVDIRHEVEILRHFWLIII